MVARRLLVAAALAVVLASAAEGAKAAAAPSCLRGGAKLVAADGNAYVVRRAAHRASGQTRHGRLYSCWARSGRRRAIADLIDTGDAKTFSRVEIIGRRYVGVATIVAGDFSALTRARTTDARTGKRIHSSSPCDDVVTGDGNRGPEHVAFLPRGGMAMSCDKLVAYGGGRGCPLQQLEPPGTFVQFLAAARNANLLFWTTGAPDGTSNDHAARVSC